MINETQKKKIRSEVILGYRKVVQERYDYTNLQKRSDLPQSFDNQRVTAFRNYFLNYLYPLPAKRDELDEAFGSLDNYIRHPEKLLRILIDSGSLIFKYGRHLPKILSAGIRALRSFRKANKFEEKLVEQAILQKLETPYSRADIEGLIKSLSLNEIEDFIVSSQHLFEILLDRKLVTKINEIVAHLIHKMEKRPNIYSSAEVRGLGIGAEIIKEGDLLFDQLNKVDQERIFNLVVKMEREILEQLFLK